MKPSVVSEYPPCAVRRVVMYQGWYRLTFLHWRYQAEAIRPLLPRELEMDLFDGSAWIGLTPFLLTGLRPPGLPPLPWISQFPEMNVRTYVRGPDGEPGIWFFTLEADRLAAVLAARASYGLPYRWAHMRVRAEADCVHYESRRIVGQGQAKIGVRTGSALQAGELERFLTARFRLYTRVAGKLAYAPVEHAPWPLRSAKVLYLEENVIESSGAPPPEGSPLAHYSPGVWVRIGWPEPVR